MESNPAQLLPFLLVEFLDRISDVRDVRDANNSGGVECCNDLTSLNQ